MQISREEAHRIIRHLPSVGGGIRGEADHRVEEASAHGDPELLRYLLDLPEVRMDKVLRLRTAILERRYAVPAEKVAEKMIFRVLADRMA
jgi:hypothetical protein